MNQADLSLIVAFLAGALSLYNTVAAWYIKASADGKITKDEVMDLLKKVTPEA